MSCASCAARINKVLNAQEGVVEATVNYATATVFVSYNEDIITPIELRNAVRKAGYDLYIENDIKKADEIRDNNYRLIKNRSIMAVSTTVLMIILNLPFMHFPYIK